MSAKRNAVWLLKYSHTRGPRLEVRIADLVADAVIVSPEYDLVVEVAVTHLVDDDKRKKLKRIQMPAIELEVWRLDRTVDWHAIRQFVGEMTEARKWLFHPQAHGLLIEAKAEAQAEARAASLCASHARMRFSATTDCLSTTTDSLLSGDWQTNATNKLKRLWHAYRGDRILDATPSHEAANMILRWNPSDAPDGDEKYHFDSLLGVVARSAYIKYRDESGAIRYFVAGP